MKKAYTVLALAVWLIILPYLGLPYSWKDILTSLSGLGFIYLSFLFYREYQETKKEKGIFDNFRENGLEEERKM